MNINCIRYHRYRNDLSINELASKSGLSAGHLRDVEVGKVPLTEKTAVKLSQVLDVPVKELYGEKIL